MKSVMEVEPPTRSVHSLTWTKTTVPLKCSFCGKTQKQVQRIIAGPAGADIYICNECIDLCGDILQEELPSWRPWLRPAPQGTDAPS